MVMLNNFQVYIFSYNEILSLKIIMPISDNKEDFCKIVLGNQYF